MATAKVGIDFVEKKTFRKYGDNRLHPVSSTQQYIDEDAILC